VHNLPTLTLEGPQPVVCVNAALDVKTDGIDGDKTDVITVHGISSL